MNGTSPVIQDKKPRDLMDGYALVYTATMAGYVGHVEADTGDRVVLRDAFAFTEGVQPAQGGGLQFPFNAWPIGFRGYREEKTFEVRRPLLVEYFRDLHPSQRANWGRATDQAEAIRDDLYSQQSGIALARTMPNLPPMTGRKP